MEAKPKRTPPEKVAILLQLVGEEVAAKILQSLPLSEVHRLTQTIIRLKPPDIEEVRAVADEFTHLMTQHGALLLPGEDFAKAVIQKAFDKPEASRLLDSMSSISERNAFDALNHVDPKVISEFTKAEHPQTTALILAHLEPSLAGKVFSHLPEVIRAQVIMRLARLKEVSPTILEEITDALQTDLLNMTAAGTEVGGLKKVADILNHTDKAVEKEIMHQIQAENPELAQGIQQLMFVFDDLVTLDDRAIQEILREVDVKLLAKALRAANEDVQDKIFKNMSQRAGEVLREDREALGPTRISEVEEAQMEIIKVTLRLRDEGRIVIQGTGDGDVLV
jgi:flagellar motor switch protein FliG